ncbi:MAG: hypothetical protein B7C24_03195 [Bacteroidetes bacterium 4572_77]|nr:MAG: hypothetical protein B7C24_03195 [Bacteroidetes bacterium 4572_77]
MKIIKIISAFYVWFINPKGARIITPKVYLNYIIFIAIGVLLAALLVNLFLDLPIPDGFVLLMLLLSITMWIVNRYTKKMGYSLIIGYFILLLIFNGFCFLSNGRFFPMTYYLFPIVFVISYFSSKKYLFYLYAGVLLNVLILAYLDLYSIFTGMAYDGEYMRIADNYFSFLFASIALIIFFIDIVKIQIQEKQIAEESIKLKTAFLANTSHDIRNPVNAIHGFCSMLDDEEMSEEELVQYVGIIQSNTKQLLSLMNDIFDISMIQSGNFVLHPHFFNLNNLLKEVHHNFSQQIKNSEKEVSFQVHYGLPDEQSAIFADNVRINQILSNLIQNAIKHTPSGVIVFGYEKIILEDKLLFYVKDTGYGIPEEKQKEIFQRHISNISEKKNLSSSGLGLHITKNLMDLMKGEVWVESKEGEGAHFYFKIPLFYQ